jgi:protein-arginine kinase
MFATRLLRINLTPRALALTTTAPRMGGGGRRFNPDYSKPFQEGIDAMPPGGIEGKEMGFIPVKTFNTYTMHGKRNLFRAVLAFWAVIYFINKVKGSAAAAAEEARIAEISSKIKAIKKSNPGNIAMNVFDIEWFKGLKEKDQKALLQIVNSGLENPDSEMGCYAMNPSDYDKFRKFFKPALEKYHKVNLDERTHITSWDLNTVQGLPADGKLDVSKFGLGPLSMRIRTGRNLQKFPLAGSMSKNDRVEMEKAMGAVFKELIANPAFGGEYVSLTPGHPNQISDARYNELVKQHIMFKNMANDSFLVQAGIASDWPHGRGCYFSADRGFIIWVGEEDHLRIMCMKKSTCINEVFDRLKAAIDVTEKLIPGGCAKSKDFGVVTSCPTNMGTGMRASVHLKLPNLTKDGTDTKAKEICKPFGLGVRGLGGEHTPIGADGTVDISPKARFCITEAEIAGALYKGVEKVWRAEQAAK